MHPWWRQSSGGLVRSFLLPPNLARTLASLSGYIATSTANGIQIHQYASSHIEAVLQTGQLSLDIDTEYPVTGKILITVVNAPVTPTEISLRIPEWAIGAELSDGIRTYPVSAGTKSVKRIFVAGDRIELTLPMEPRFSWPDSRIDAIRGCVAVERGPEVYALESVDLPGGWELEEAQVDVAEGFRTRDREAVTVTLQRQTFEDGISPVPLDGITRLKLRRRGQTSSPIIPGRSEVPPPCASGFPYPVQELMPPRSETSWSLS
ncbi:hypothetical protein ACW0JT_18965 [Arthrobacter sp. SA17]